MKVELVRRTDQRTWTIEQIGNVLWIAEQAPGAAPHETSQRCFDSEDAQQELRALVTARRADGFEPSDAMKLRQEHARVRSDLATEARRVARALAEAPAPATAAYEHLRFLVDSSDAEPTLRRLAGSVSRISDDTTGLSFHLANGARLLFSDPAGVRGARDPRHAAAPPPVAQLWSRHEWSWLYTEEHAASCDEHSVLVGPDAGPPLGDAELAGTALDGQPVLWVLQELPWDRYWFFDPTSRDAAGAPRLRCLELDGGLQECVDLPFGAWLLQRWVERAEL